MLLALLNVVGFGLSLPAMRLRLIDCCVTSDMMKHDSFTLPDSLTLLLCTTIDFMAFSFPLSFIYYGSANLFIPLTLGYNAPFGLVD